MLRTQILITPEQRSRLDYLAELEQQSISGVIRQALDTYFGMLQKKSTTTNNLLKRAEEAVAGAPKDLASNDEYLYKT